MFREVHHESKIIAQNRWTHPGRFAPDRHRVAGRHDSGGAKPAAPAAAPSGNRATAHPLVPLVAGTIRSGIRTEELIVTATTANTSSATAKRRMTRDTRMDGRLEKAMDVKPKATIRNARTIITTAALVIMPRRTGAASLPDIAKALGTRESGKR